MAEPGTQMSAEIAEQPHALAATLEALLPLREEIRQVTDGRRHVAFLARGSSDNAATYGRYLLNVHAGVDAHLGAPSLATHYDAHLDLSDTLVVAISQSGATQEIVQAQAWARRCGAATVAVTNVAGSPLVAGADLALVTRAGEEVAVPATKTYLTQLAAMAVLGSALGPQGSDVDAVLERTPQAVADVTRATVESPGLPSAVLALAGARGNTMVSGRGLLLGTAQEVALKLEETCLRPVRGYSYADLRHGPISVVDGASVAVLVCAADGPLVAGMTDLAADLRARGARIVGIGGDPGFVAACDVALPGPDLPEVLAPLGLIVPAQVAIHRLALGLGLDPDAPRGLRKVTQTESTPTD